MIIYFILLIFTAMKFLDWTMGSTATLKFATLNKCSTRSVQPIIISIVDDSFLESTECLICSIQAGMVQSVRIVAPKQVTICIIDIEGKKGRNLDSAGVWYYKAVTLYRYSYIPLFAPSNIAYTLKTLEVVLHCSLPIMDLCWCV